MKNKKQKPIVVAVSGGFDPIHLGHIRLMEAAKKFGDKLVVIINNDNWLKKKKGYAFIGQSERKGIIEALSCVDTVVVSSHPKNSKDMSVCAELKKIRPDIFANGGDRTYKNIPEVAVCEEIGCKMVFNIGHGGKIQSSSWLLENYLKKVNSKK
jgi:D-beta-D-heptose 7-phosphate kinase/D-beta-D-heptose 1-phosphate adenosyltransferase